MEVDDRQAAQIHGIIFSDSDSDYDNQRDIDEEYNALKPPPLNYETIKDKIVVISQTQTVNVWEERMKAAQKKNEEQIQIGNNVQPVAKKKKKKSKSKTAGKVENIGVAAIGNAEVQDELKKLGAKKKNENNQQSNTPLSVQIGSLPKLPKETAKKKLKDDSVKILNSPSNENVVGVVTASKTKKKGSSQTVFYDPNTLTKLEENLDKLRNIWHSGLNPETIQQELNLQRQKESSMYEDWLKSVRPPANAEPESTASGNKPAEKKKDKVGKSKEKAGASPSNNLLENFTMTDIKDKVLEDENGSATEVNGYSRGSCIEVIEEVKITDNSIDPWWELADIMENKIQLLPDSLGNNESNSEFNSNTKTTNTLPATNKKSKKKKKKKKFTQLIDVSLNQNLEDNSVNTETNSIDVTEEQNRDETQIKTLNCLEVPCTQQVQNPKLLEEETAKYVWLLPDNNDTKLQSYSWTEIVKTESNSEDIKHVDAMPAATKKTKTKNKKKKKLKQPTTEQLPAIGLLDEANQSVCTSTEKTLEDRVKQKLCKGNSADVSGDHQINKEIQINVAHEKNPVDTNPGMTFDTPADNAVALERPECVFDEQFKDFIQSIDCKDTDTIPKLNDFKYEQLYRAYIAYQRKKTTSERQDVATSVAGVENRTKKSNPCQSFKNLDTNEIFCSMPRDDKANYIDSKAEVPQRQQIPKKKFEILDNVKEDWSLAHLNNAPSFSTKTEYSTKSVAKTIEPFKQLNQIEPFKQLNQISTSNGAARKDTVRVQIGEECRDDPTNILQKNEVSEKNSYVEPVVQNSLYSKIPDGGSRDDSNTNLRNRQDKTSNFTASRDFEKFFEVFKGVYYDVTGVEFVTTANDNQYRLLYQVIQESKKRNSCVGDENKEIVKRSVPKSTVGGSTGLSYHLDRPNDNIRSKSHVTAVNNGWSSPLNLRDTNYRQNMIPSQGIVRRAPKTSWENRNYYGRSSDYVENNFGGDCFSMPRRMQVNSQQLRHWLDGGDYDRYSFKRNRSDVEFSRIYDSAYFNNSMSRRDMETTRSMNYGEWKIRDTLQFVKVVFIVGLGIFIASVIVSFVLFLRDNIIYILGVLLLFLILLKA